MKNLSSCRLLDDVVDRGPAESGELKIYRGLNYINSRITVLKSFQPAFPIGAIKATPKVINFMMG